MAATYLDPLTDLYSHKKKIGILANAISKAKPSQGIDDIEGYAEGGGIMTSIDDWMKQNIIRPATNLVQSIIPHPQVAATPPLQPAQVGTGYLNQSGTAAQTHNQAVQKVAEETGYAQGGARVDDPLKRVMDSPAATLGRNIVAGAAYPGAAIMDVGGKILNTANAFVGGDKNYFDTSNLDQLKNYAATGKVAPTGEKYPTYYGPQDDLTTLPEKTATPDPVPAATPPVPKPMPITTSTVPAIDNMPAPKKTTDPLTEVAPVSSNFAQVGKKRIGIDDIGVQGKDPLATNSVATNQQVATSPEYAGLRHNEAMAREQAQVNATYNRQVADAVRANLIDGKAPTLEQIKTLGLTPADVNTMLAANNKGGRFDKAIEANVQQQQAALSAQLTGAEIADKQAHADFLKKGAGKIDPEEALGLKKEELALKSKAQSMNADSINIPALSEAVAQGQDSAGSIKGSMGNPVSAKVKSKVLEKYPKFNFGMSEANIKWRTNPRNLVTISQIEGVLPRLNALASQADTLKNSDFPAWNKVINEINRQTGKPEVTNFESNRNAIVQEVNTALSGSSTGSDFRVKIELENIGSARSPVQLAGAVKNLQNALLSRRDTGVSVPYPPEVMRGEKSMEQWQKETKSKYLGDYKEHGEAAPTSADAAPAGGGAPPAPGARQAPDGKWYVSDPARPGKYLEVRP